MEHVADPSAALEIVAGLASPWAIVSVPREPLWRVLNLGRLKYVRELGNTPGHLQSLVARRRSCASSSGASRSSSVRSPMPWTMALCRTRGVSAPASTRRAARRPASADRLARHRVGPRHARDGLGAAVHLRPGPRARRRTRGDRPLAMGDEGQGLGRRPLLLGEGARAGRPHASRLSGARRRGRQDGRPRCRRERPRWQTARGGIRPMQIRPEPVRVQRRACPPGRDPDRARDADRLGADPGRAR